MSGINQLEFIDTNILVYAFDNTAGQKNKTGRDLILSLWDKQSGCMSIQVLQEFYTTVTQKIKAPIDSETASGIINDFSVWRVYSPDVNDILAAMQLKTRYQLSFWDAMIIHSAQIMGCKMLWSEDLNDGQVFEGVIVQNPFKKIII